MPAYLTNDVLGFFIIFARIGAMIMLMPGLGDDGVPARVRLTIALLVTIIVYPVVFIELPPMPNTLVALAAVLGRETVLGLLLGGAVRILTQSLHVAGTVIATQSGLASALMFDPSAGTQGTVVSRFLAVLGLTILFAANIHHIFFEGIVRSYALFSASGDLMVEDFAMAVVRAVAQSFTLGIQLSAPFLVLGVVLNVGLGLISRLIPTLQIFFVAMPVGILLSFVLLLAVIGLMMNVYADALAQSVRLVMGG